MSKPSISEIAEYIEPLEDGGLGSLSGGDPGRPEGDAPPPEGGSVAVPGYGKVGAGQAGREAAARFRMIADALEAGKNVPRSAVDIAVAMFDEIQPEAEVDPDAVGGFGRDESDDENFGSPEDPYMGGVYDKYLGDAPP